MAELQPHDKVTLEAIRRRAYEVRDAKRLSHWSTTYREDVRFLLDRIDELTGAAIPVLSPEEN